MTDERQKLHARFRLISEAFHQANRNAGNRPCAHHEFENCPAEVCANNRSFLSTLDAVAQREATRTKEAFFAGWRHGHYDAGDHDCRMMPPTAERAWDDYLKETR